MFYLNKSVLVLAVPFIISLVAVIKHSVLLLVILILVHFLVIKFVPVFRGRENLWMFIIVAISTIPLNIYIIKLLNEVDVLFGSLFILDIMRSIVCYIAILSFEEVIMGVITRFIWKKQYMIEV